MFRFNFFNIDFASLLFLPPPIGVKKDGSNLPAHNVWWPRVGVLFT